MSSYRLDPLVVAQSSIRVLNFTQRASALSFSSFLVLHFSAPLASTLAPSFAISESYASGFMVLGRVWYQGDWSEAVVVWGSLGVHLGSGILGRLLKVYERKERRRRRKVNMLKEDAENAFAEGKKEEVTTIDVPLHTTSYLSLIPFHQLTGYLLLPLAIHHSWTHRLIPSDPTPPISGLSPTLFSYSFVSYSLSSLSSARFLSALSYTAITVLGGYHALSGLRRIAYPMAPRGLKPRARIEGRGVMEEVSRRSWQGAYAVLLVGVGIGVGKIATNAVPAWLGRRYEDVLRVGFPAVL